MKIYRRESANGDFPCAKLENANKNLILKKTGTYIDLFIPTFVPNLVTLAGKMSSGMPKEAGSFNGPLYSYLMM